VPDALNIGDRIVRAGRDVPDGYASFPRAQSPPNAIELRVSDGSEPFGVYFDDLDLFCYDAKSEIFQLGD
jgi:hypothetical protein